MVDSISQSRVLIYFRLIYEEIYIEGWCQHLQLGNNRYGDIQHVDQLHGVFSERLHQVPQLKVLQIICRHTIISQVNIVLVIYSDTNISQV